MNRKVYAIGAAVLVLAAGIAFALWSARAKKGNSQDFKSLKNPVPLNEQTLKAAKAIYEEKCLGCHGETGKGDGPEAMMYDPPPADLADSHKVHTMTDGEIFHQISEGGKPMPAFKKQLSEEQRWQLVHYVRSLAPKHE
jgi:mono/diheme cytochrome c family protein